MRPGTPSRHPYLTDGPDPAGSRRAQGAEGRLPDYYALLGVRHTATQEEVEAAFRRYVRAIHPDQFFNDPQRQREAQDRLKAANAAMQVLRDPVLRWRYDAALDHLPLASRLEPPPRLTT